MEAGGKPKSPCSQDDAVLIRREEDEDGDGDAEGGLVPAGPGRTSSGGRAAYRAVGMRAPPARRRQHPQPQPHPGSQPLPIPRTLLSGGSAEHPRKRGKEISFMSSYSPSLFPS